LNLGVKLGKYLQLEKLKVETWFSSVVEALNLSFRKTAFWRQKPHFTNLFFHSSKQLGKEQNRVWQK